MIIPQTEDEFYKWHQIYKNCLTRGFEFEFKQVGGLNIFAYKLTFSKEIIHSLEVIKYLSLVKIESQEINFSLEDTENVDDVISQKGSDPENFGDTGVDEQYRAFTNQPNFRRGFKHKTTININNNGPLKQKERAPFIQPKRLETMLTNKSELKQKRSNILNKFASEKAFDPEVPPSKADYNYYESGKRTDIKIETKQAKKTKTDHSLLGEFKDHTRRVMYFQGGESQSMSKTSRSSFDGNHIESALLVNSETLTRKILYFFVYIFILTGIGLQVAAYLWSVRDIEQINDTVVIRNTTSVREYALLDLIRSVRQLELVGLGILPEDYAGHGSFREIIYQEFSTSSKFVHESNVYLRQMIHYIDLFLLVEYYENKDITLTSALGDDNMILQLNAFDLINTITSKINELLSRDSSTINPDDSDIQFILMNAAGDLLVKLDGEYNILQKHIDFCFVEMQEFLNGDLAGECAFFFFMLGFYFVEEILSRRKRIYFLNSFMLIDENEADKHMQNLKEFYSAYEGHEGYHEKYLSKGRLEGKSRQDKKENKKIMKYGNFESLDRLFYLRLLYFIIIGVFTCLDFLFLGLNVTKFEHEFSLHIDGIKAIENQIFDYTLVFGGIYQYIGSNKTSILKNVNIKEALETNLNYLKNSQEEIPNLFNRQTLNIPKSKQILKDDLCSMFADDVELCFQHDSRAASRGLLSFHSVLLNAIQTSKSYFDQSSQDFNAMKISLNTDDMTNTKIQFDMIYRKTFLTIADEFTNDMLDLVQHYWNIDLILMIVFIIFGLTFGFVIHFGIIKNSQKEMEDVKLLLRMIPMKTILSSKVLHNHLFSSSHSILGEISRIKK